MLKNFNLFPFSDDELSDIPAFWKEDKRITEYEEELNRRKKMLKLENKLMKLKKEKELKKEDFERIEELKKGILEDEKNLCMLKDKLKKENKLKNEKHRQENQEGKFLFLFLKMTFSCYYAFR